jgi:curved DNA-binding protein CbpA
LSEAPARFQKIAKAYEVLSNAEKREKYDHFCANPAVRKTDRP